jgi:cytochrome c
MWRGVKVAIVFSACNGMTKFELRTEVKLVVSLSRTPEARTGVTLACSECHTDGSRLGTKDSTWTSFAVS